MQITHYNALSDATKEFLAMAKQYHFCIEYLPDIEKRLYAESPFHGEGTVENREENKNG